MMRRGNLHRILFGIDSLLLGILVVVFLYYLRGVDVHLTKMHLYDVIFFLDFFLDLSLSFWVEVKVNVLL